VDGIGLGSSGIAIGGTIGSVALTTGGIALGLSSSVEAVDAIAIGSGAGLVNGATARSVVIGQGASFLATGGGVIVGGTAAATTFTGAVIVGLGAAVGGVSGTAVGAGATTAGSQGTAVGASATASASDSIALGVGAVAASVESIAIGTSSTTTASNQLMCGGSSAAITSVIFGNGDTAAAPTATVTLRVTDATGAATGSALTVRAGNAAGAGVGGAFTLEAGTSGAGTGGELVVRTGDTALATRVRVLPTGLVGIGSGTPLSTLDVQGSLGHAVTSISASTTADATAVVWLIDASLGAVTLTLPTAASAQRRIYHVKRIDSVIANAVLVDGNGAETIDGAPNQSLIAQYESIEIVSDGTAWYIL